VELSKGATAVYRSENPQEVTEQSYIPQVNVWYAVIKNNTIDPFFFEEPETTGRNFPALMGTLP
jgi:hypothetical protein